MRGSVDLLTIGDSCIDLYMQVTGHNVSEEKDEGQPKICFFHGSKIPVKTLKTNIAGNAVNVSIGTSKLGMKTAIYSETGNDEHADRICKELEMLGIDTSLVHRNDNVITGIHPVIVYAGERTIFSHHDQKSYQVSGWPETKWIYYTSIGPGFEDFQNELVSYMINHPETGVAFNPGTYHLKTGLEKLRNILEVTHVIFLNSDEAKLLTGNFPTDRLHIEVQKLGPKLTIITEGSKGASAHDGTHMLKTGTYKIDTPVTDRTGAGDAFAAGALSALFHKKPLQEVLKWGAINSSCVIREIGAINGLKNKEQMEKLSKKFTA